MSCLYEEKRKHPRAKNRIGMKISTLQGEVLSPRGKTFSEDISEGGLSSNIPLFIQMAKRLLLEMEIPGTGEKTAAIAKVAWIEKKPFPSGYKAGFHFLEASKKDRASIESYVSSLLKKEKVLSEV